MPKLPVVSGKECRKAFGYLGFEEARQRGSHLLMRRGASGCVVPMHAAIKTIVATAKKLLTVPVDFTYVYRDSTFHIGLGRKTDPPTRGTIITGKC